MAANFLSTAVYLTTLLLQLILHQALATNPIDPTEGFISLPLNNSNIEIQRPYDVPENQRYSFDHGVHKLWVFKTDKPHSPTSQTHPRTEIRIRGYDYTSGVWQFEGYGYVPRGTSGVCIMQVFGATPPHATTFMLNVYNASLTYYRTPVVIVSNIYDRWFRLNVIHDADANTVKVYIDGIFMFGGSGRWGKHFFKCGVYAQDGDSFYMESRWKGIKVLKKCD